ncbi:hypothetical protein [Zooshikella ganghwensis]|uniref:Tetratricopeptide repeat protein n=1 Tax=Zooshikella ganghwensis TaxID=202772 RepID=A0A4P9VP72_9GAMM|nr:hypothetical protein [Zooshikella ganghwensis]RDH45288.1 hypothetical protein B9G39_18560 [Zooshikella ganghwensis]
MRSLETRWRQLTFQGSEAFHTEQYREAQKKFFQALFVAEEMLLLEDCRGAHLPVVQLFMIACHNLADTYLALGFKIQAFEYYRKAYTDLVHLLNSPRADAGLRQQAQECVSKAADEWQQAFNTIDKHILWGWCNQQQSINKPGYSIPYNARH